MTQTAMEIHGGVGFLSEYPVERLHREALIMPIWEGPSNIQALDMLEAMAKKGAHLALLRDMEVLLPGLGGDEMGDLAVQRIKDVLQGVSSWSESEAQFYAKDTLNILGHAVASLVLIDLGKRLKTERYMKIGRLYATYFLEGRHCPAEVLGDALQLIKSD